MTLNKTKNNYNHMNERKTILNGRSIKNTTIKVGRIKFIQ